MRNTLLWGITLVAAGSFALADDWPIYRGPHHDGSSRETGWRQQWPAGGPKALWKAKVGIGFSSFAVAGGRAYTMGNAGDKDTVFCFDAITGRKLWSHTYAAELGPLYYDGGPGATPTVDGDRVYSLSKWGDLFCFETATGKILWQRQIAKEEKFRLGDWGYSGAPFPHGKLLLLNAGPAGLAVDKLTGKTVWSSGDAEAGYSTPCPFQWQGQTAFIFSSGEGYAAVEPAGGRVIWKIDWPTRYGVNATDPIVVGDEVFLSTGYAKGAGMFRMRAGQPEELWANRQYRTQLNTSVLVDGHLYGPDGDSASRARLKCVEWKTGREMWEDEGAGFASVLLADGKLMVLSPKGELMIAPPSPKEFKPTARAKVLGGTCWTVPVLANGLIYCRNNKGDVVCLDVRGK